MQTVHIEAAAQSVGWNVIVVERDALNDQEKLDASTNTRDLTDSNPYDANFLTAHPYIGSSLGCYSGSSTDILLTLTAISDNPEDTVEDQAVETVTTTQPT